MNQSRPGRGTVVLAIAVALCGLAIQPSAIADTLPWALAQAYVNNPTINAQRAAMRATDEGVPIALSGYRPTVKGTIVAGSNDQFQTTKTLPTIVPLMVGRYPDNAIGTPSSVARIAARWALMVGLLT